MEHPVSSTMSTSISFSRGAMPLYGVQAMTRQSNICISPQIPLNVIVLWRMSVSCTECWSSIPTQISLNTLILTMMKGSICGNTRHYLTFPYRRRQLESCGIRISSVPCFTCTVLASSIQTFVWTIYFFSPSTTPYFPILAFAVAPVNRIILSASQGNRYNSMAWQRRSRKPRTCFYSLSYIWDRRGDQDRIVCR